MTAEQAKLFIGCISGTSVDGLDVAAISIDPDLTVECACTFDLPDALRSALLALHVPGADGVDEVGRCDLELGRFIGNSINDFVARFDLDAEAIGAIGSHGQTIRHRPPANDAAAFTVQIGDPNQIAEITGRTVVADFRRRDMAAHGQGAPLVPPFHRALFAHTGAKPVVLNVGGIANISILEDPLRGFDTGPGNALLDAWYDKHHSGPYDAEGAWAASGNCDAALLKTLLEDPYFDAPPPKSTGREYFTSAWLDQHLGNTDPADVQATLAELTAQSVANAIERWAEGCSNIIVCGGGRLNAHLLALLGARNVAPVTASEAWGVDGDSIEAAAFAWLAHRTLEGLAGNAPAVTGASGDRVLGAIYP